MMRHIANQVLCEYGEAINHALKVIDPEKLADIAEVIYGTKKDHRTIFIAGNGGSASVASHMACDFSKGTLLDPSDSEEKRFKVIALTDNVPHMTALGNDLSYEDIFTEPLKNLAQAGDVLIVISGSGNSPNILKAAACAKKKGIITIGLLGFCKGGKCADLVDHALIIESNHYGPIEDLHNVLSHMLTCMLKTKAEAEIKAETHDISLNPATPFTIKGRS